MSGSSFKVNRRDLEFVLFEQLDLDAFQHPAYAGYDGELYRTVIAEASRLAEETIAPLNAKGDAVGCRFEAGEVRTPPGYREAYQAFRDAGWTAVVHPQDVGGQGLPVSVALACVEIFTAACPAFSMYPGLTAAAANLIRERGSDWMKSALLPKLISGEWSGTMCLTEPQAGSAVGDARTIATRDGDSYRLRGTKIFVSSGEHDLTENIIHMMLARTPDAPPGIKGLSLFVVPKFLLNADGSLGARNDVVCSGIEHKMGIKGSSTCTLSVGDKDGAVGFIVGREGEGIQHMFLMMNEARIGVGVQGYAVAAAAYDAALRYAKDRVQGTRAEEFKDANARRVAIIEHADVRRMLAISKAQVEGMRALGLWLAHLGNLWHLDPDSAEGQKNQDLLEVLTPICKAYCSDTGFDVTRQAIQVHGGYGYCSEYPVEQYMRDAKIFSIYEGTNGIQAMDLLGRKMARNGGMSFMQALQWVNERIEKLEGAGGFDTEVGLIGKARDRLGASAMHLSGLGMAGDAGLPMFHAYDVLLLFGDVVIAALLAEQAALAKPMLERVAGGVDLSNPTARRSLLESNDEARFLAGKLDNIRVFASQVLPRTAGLAHIIQSTDRTALDAVF
jgi:alkylation response protein AidB-like acyl-CoA dehydrogenase